MLHTEMERLVVVECGKTLSSLIAYAAHDPEYVILRQESVDGTVDDIPVRKDFLQAVMYRLVKLETGQFRVLDTEDGSMKLEAHLFGEFRKAILYQDVTENWHEEITLNIEFLEELFKVINEITTP